MTTPLGTGPTADPTVNAFFAALGTRDLDGLLALIAEDATWTIPGDPAIVPWTGERHGRDALPEGFFTPLFEAAEPLAFEVLHSHTGDGTVYVHGSFRYRFHVSRQVLDDEFVMRFTVADGRITSYRIFEDSLGLARAHTGDLGLGLSGV
ncbi:nuclear transport factor 2 family protein [Streptomyces sp. HU2014]|uniref:nuclear transport factor 2 family protein n=1 Tax=Streptomyces sp. HU2014 TaxID=2939414 RepID=UPI00201087C6|nr:nuclear transport factor 2 family protein [Streptomyces sp. HU2014]UQI46525.1 nuclear transport factor 2 family protein [Streptomyces sp. HU2014]